MSGVASTAAGAPSSGELAHRPATRHKRWVLGSLWLAAPGLAFLAVFFLLPVLRLISLSAFDADTGAVTSAHYARIYGTSIYFRVLLTTFEIAGGTAALSVLLGYPLAWWLARQPDRRQGWLILLVMLPFWTSYLVKAFAWMVVLGREGPLNRMLLGSGLANAPVQWLHELAGTMIGMVHAMLPLAVLTMLPVMNALDRRLSQAAGALGASPAQAFWRIDFPATLPGVTAAGLLTFISSLGFFIVPALLGGRRQTMLAQLIITQVQEMLNWGFAGALAALMVTAALITCWFYNRLFGLSSLQGEASGTRTGSDTALRRLGLGVVAGVARVADLAAGLSEAATGGRIARFLLPSVAWTVLTFLILPTLVVIPMGFTSSSFITFPPPGFSLRWFQEYFGSPIWIAATVRSFGVAFATAFAATLLGGLAALALARSRSRWRGAVFTLFLAPMIVPRIVLAVGLFYLFAQLGLVATDLGLVIGHTVLALPFVVVTLAAVLKGYDWRLDQAAAVLGAGRLRILALITAPLLRGGLIAAFLFAFITSLDELSVAIFVSGGSKTTLPKQMWDDMVMQINPTLAAVSVVVLAVVTSLLVLAERLRRSA